MFEHLPSAFIATPVLPSGGPRTIAEVQQELATIYASATAQGGKIVGSHSIPDADQGAVTYIVSHIPR